MTDLRFVILSFEGPDLYSRAGGIASRVDELSRTLTDEGYETHLVFVGDPDLPGHEDDVTGLLHLHRWCQWISRYHPGGVYDGEEGKRLDFEDSLPAWLASELLAPAVAQGASVVVLAEEWQTAWTVIRLRRLVDERGWGEQVRLFWNANNTFSFHRIDWPSLDQAATITTVSRYMKHEMWRCGVDPRVIPNGIAEEWLQPSDAVAVADLREVFSERLTVFKVGRFDPNKRWLAAVDAVAQAKELGMRPLFLARGGDEAHGYEVIERARARGLIATRLSVPANQKQFRESLTGALSSDMVLLDAHLDFRRRKLMYEAADAVLANSAIEPFGLVGLEAMASGAFTLVGSTGEDYASSGLDSISLQTAEPREIVHYLQVCASAPDFARRIRLEARASAARFTWSSILDRAFLPLLRELGVTARTPLQVLADPPSMKVESNLDIPAIA